MATWVARRPSVLPLASTTYQSRRTLSERAKTVLIRRLQIPGRRPRRCAPDGTTEDGATGAPCKEPRILRHGAGHCKAPTTPRKASADPALPPNIRCVHAGKTPCTEPGRPADPGD